MPLHSFGKAGGAVNVSGCKKSEYAGRCYNTTLLPCYNAVTVLQCYEVLDDATDRRPVPATAPLKMHISHEWRNPPSPSPPSPLLAH